MAQFRKDTQAYLSDSKTVYEVNMTADRRGNILSGEYYLDIAKGKIAGHSVAFITGRAESFSVPSTIWNVGGLYPWSAWNAGAQVLYINSSSASDTLSIVLNGLDTNFNPVTTTVQLNGTSYVNTGAVTFRRLNSAYTIDAGTMNVGTINIHVGSSSGTIVGRVNPNIGQTSMSIYTVPANHTAYTVYGDFSVNKGEGAELNARWRFPNSGFITVYAIEVFQSSYHAMPPVPGALPEKTDIDNIAQFVTTPNGTRVYSNQQLILVNNQFI